MADVLFLKLLTLKSDLGWFRAIYKGEKLRGRQKGITLGAKLIKAAYPAMVPREAAYRTAVAAQQAAKALGEAGQEIVKAEKVKAREAGHIPTLVTIYGPGGKNGFKVARRIVLQRKNWRLDGQFIDEPENEPGRFYPALKDGDLAIMAFSGIEFPTAASVLLLGNNPADSALRAKLLPMVKKRVKSMVRLDPVEMQALADTLGLGEDHPLRSMATDTVVAYEMEQAAFGDPGAAEKVRARRGGRHMTAEELAASLERAAATGRVGEEMVDWYLQEQTPAGAPRRHRRMWPDSANHPYDFEIFDATVALEAVLDVKSTSGAWTLEMFMSMSEVEHAATSTVPYFIYRVSEVSEIGAWLRISGDIRPLAKAISAAYCPAYPKATRATTIGIRPADSDIVWSDPIRLDIAELASASEPAEDEEGEEEDEEEGDDGPEEDDDTPDTAP
ncbi:protein NO VEIN domain-containing protein [Rhodovastum atsumiense]|uniref:DUF3883 domain-containing protein n=1 Tax=Rhodovastum atsumiense TaxID=504468 RepID=A0A5M6IWH6_9PROT|nr:DUF3883 domain-containing protein [Rhodovastum atsumiense]KAA5611818.1 DUF3883 domain-containing protein [Rhodovastum atsumiense]